MNRALPLVCALVLVSGCSSVVPGSNQPPKAYITSISPAEVTEDETVTFVGYGTDVDGEVVGYRWDSDVDGELSRSPDFETDSLSVGDHVISFMVQDSRGSWSTEVHGSVTVLAAVAAPAKVNSFTVSLPSIQVGDSVTLSWNTSNASTVSIDPGVGAVPAIGSVVVTPAVSATYRLTATGGGATVTAEVTVDVVVPGPELAITFFEAEPEAVPSGDAATLSWATTGATQVRILPVIGEVAAAGSVDVTVSGEETYTFTLVATDGESTVTADAEIESYLAMPTGHTVELTAVIAESGYVRSTGGAWTNFIYVGDDTNDAGLQGFVSFDISDIPSDAMIATVEVDMSNSDTTYGAPFGPHGLMCLEARVQDYGTLDSSDYASYNMTGDAMGSWCSQSELDVPGGGSTDGFKDALQSKVGQDRFQIRLQFSAGTDLDGNNDLVRWLGTKLPRLTVHYYSYD